MFNCFRSRSRKIYSNPTGNTRSQLIPGKSESYFGLRQLNIACPTGNFYLFSLFPDLFHLISRTGPHTDETKIANEYVMPEAVMVGSRGAGVGSKTAAVEPAEKKNTKMKEKVSEREIEYIIRRPLAILTGVEAVVL